MRSQKSYWLIVTEAAFKRTVYGTPHEIQQRLSTPVARASARGVKVNHHLRNNMAFMLQEDIASSQRWFADGARPSLPTPTLLLKCRGCSMTSSDNGAFSTVKPSDQPSEPKSSNPSGQHDILLRPPLGPSITSDPLETPLPYAPSLLTQMDDFVAEYSIPGTETFRFASSKDPLDLELTCRISPMDQEQKKRLAPS